MESLTFYINPSTYACLSIYPFIINYLRLTFDLTFLVCNCPTALTCSLMKKLVSKVQPYNFFQVMDG